MSVGSPTLQARRNGPGLRSFFVGPWGYLALAVLIVAVLWAGSGTKHQSPDAARIAHLESIIRCPSCADLSIANSETTSANGLRVEVARLVGEGRSDQAIEAQIEAQYPGTLLVPSGEAGVAVFVIPAVVIVAGALTFVLLLVRRRNRVGPVVDEEDLELVRAAQDRRRTYS